MRPHGRQEYQSVTIRPLPKELSGAFVGHWIDPYNYLPSSRPALPMKLAPVSSMRSLFALLAVIVAVGAATPVALAQGSVLERLMGDEQGGAPSGGLLDLGGPDQPKFLHPDEAFYMDAKAVPGEGVRVEWLIQPEHYLYRGRSSVTATGADAELFGEAVFAPGKEKQDEYFGLVEVWYEKGSAMLPLGAGLAEPRTVELNVTYQGCADAGLCYPPITRVVQVDLPAGPLKTAGDVLGAAAPAGGDSGSGSGVAATTAQDAAGGSNTVTFVSEQDALASRLASGSLWLTLATFFGLGLLLTFTPCVLPMLPIISSIVVGQGEQATRRRAFTLSLAYVMAMALTYTVVGVIVGLTGAGVQAALQAPGVLVATAVLFVILSLSMFGVYELSAPGVHHRSAEQGGRSPEGRLARRCGGHGHHLRADRQPLRGGAASRCTHLHRPDRRCRARRCRAVLPRARHGPAGAAGRHFGRPADAEGRRVDGSRQGRVRHRAAGDGAAGAGPPHSRLGDGRRGRGAVHHRRRVPRCTRYARSGDRCWPARRQGRRASSRCCTA